jgi:hypothetical protein
MPEQITVRKELGIIEVDSYGSVTREDSLSSLAALEELMKETGITRVLSDTRKQESTPSTVDIFDFGAHLPQSMKLAVIVSERQPTAHNVAFVDDVAYNRGVNIKVFGSRSEALEWLQG